MKKIFTCFCFFYLLSFHSLFSQDIIGFWKSIDEKTGRPQSIIGIYEYQGAYYGRIIVTYNDEGSVADTIYNAKERAPGVIGHPFYAGMDIIWELEKHPNKYKDGHILDPEHGKIYDAELWINHNKLVVRGELLFFGRNQEWPLATEKDFPPNFKKPDLAKLVPTIPKVNG